MRRTITRIALLAVGLGAFGCAAGERPPNTPPRGFKALFNGQDLTGWKGLVDNPMVRAELSAQEMAAKQAEVDKVMREHWNIVDGTLVFDGHGSHLCTDKDYRDFEMYVDWKIGKNGDSGLYLRGTPQVQIWDPFEGTAGGHEKGSGGLYNNQKNPRHPLVCADNPTGEWNTFWIKMVRENVWVDLNGQRVVDGVPLENYWDRGRSIFPVGQIELQSHGSTLYFRNIYLKEIPREPLPGIQKLIDAAKWQPLFDGESLGGWQVIGGGAESWGAEDGLLFTTGKGGGWIATEKEFDDFLIELEFKVPPGGNSGVFLRAPREGNPAFAGMEIQVLDDAADEYNNLKAYQYCASLYATEAANPRVSKPAGEWQKMRILCCGREVMVWLNDTLVTDANLDDHQKRFEGHPGLNREGGFIGLQNHGSRLDYRNIRIKELTP